MKSIYASKQFLKEKINIISYVKKKQLAYKKRFLSDTESNIDKNNKSDKKHSKVME
jgi:hypothetical protein